MSQRVATIRIEIYIKKFTKKKKLYIKKDSDLKRETTSPMWAKLGWACAGLVHELVYHLTSNGMKPGYIMGIHVILYRHINRYDQTKVGPRNWSTLVFTTLEKELEKALNCFRNSFRT